MRKGELAVCIWIALSSASLAASCATSTAPGAVTHRAEADPAETSPPGTSLAETNPDAAYGARLFRIYCQSCHGEHGRGDGPVARELSLELPDLRRLAERADDGLFPSMRVAAVIDGREPIAGHGTSEMPVWGLTFRDPGLVAEQESDVEERISALVAFLRSIQERR